MAPSVSNITDRSMDVSWQQPLDDGGSSIIGYRVEARLNQAGDWQLFETSKFVSMFIEKNNLRSM